MSASQGVFAAVWGTGARVVHLGGASAAAALRARTTAAWGEAARLGWAWRDDFDARRSFARGAAYVQVVPGGDVAADALGATLATLRDFGQHRLAGYLERNPTSWLARAAPGIVFDRQRQRALGTSSTMHHEVYVMCARCPSGYARLDTYDERNREIVSRKYAQLWAVNERTAKRYIDELATKYSPGTMIADVPSSRRRELAKRRLVGTMILEVPVQKGRVPQRVLDYARGLDPPVIIRDVDGLEY